MTTLNARANQAYQALVDELEAEDQVLEFSSAQGAFEEGWETGYNTAAAESAPRPVVDREALLQVLLTHNVECTGPGEVTCRGCRGKSWMTWRAYREHVADAVLALLNGSES